MSVFADIVLVLAVTSSVLFVPMVFAFFLSDVTSAVASFAADVGLRCLTVATVLWTITAVAHILAAAGAIAGLGSGSG